MGLTERSDLPSWVTCRVLDKPPPATVMVAERGDVDVFSDKAVTVMVWSLFPEAGESDIQESLVVAVQEMLAAVTEKEAVLEAGYAREIVAGLISSLGAPFCVRVTVRVMLLPVTEIVAERGEVEGLSVFAAMVTVCEELPEVGDISSQVWSDEILQEVLAEDILRDAALPLFHSRERDAGETSRAGAPACVMVMEAERPPPETVRVAVLGEEDGLSWLAVTETDRELLSETGVTLSQSGIPETDQEILAEET